MGFALVCLDPPHILHKNLIITIPVFHTTSSFMHVHVHFSLSDSILLLFLLLSFSTHCMIWTSLTSEDNIMEKLKLKLKITSLTLKFYIKLIVVSKKISWPIKDQHHKIINYLCLHLILLCIIKKSIPRTSYYICENIIFYLCRSMKH